MAKHFFHSRDDIPGLTITDAIEQTKMELDLAYTNFEHAVEPDLIDCYIYQLQSAQMRYKFLLDCAKKAEPVR